MTTIKIYLVAQSSDEYSDTLQLPDVLGSGPLSPYHTAEVESVAFKSLEEAKSYYNSFDGNPAHDDGSGNMIDDLSIYETNLSI